ncbi:MAG: peptide-methionine (S)-S-oxide reductase, partial [Gammaproteobacteria bacterium]
MPGFHKSIEMPSQDGALPGRVEKMPVSATHFVNGHSISPPFPEDMQQIIFGMGCFWGVEKVFWQQQGVYTTAVGYAAGYTPNPTYDEICSGQTG